MEKNIQRTMPNNRKTKTDENTKYAKFMENGLSLCNIPKLCGMLNNI